MDELNTFMASTLGMPRDEIKLLIEQNVARAMQGVAAAAPGGHNPPAPAADSPPRPAFDYAAIRERLENSIQDLRNTLNDTTKVRTIEALQRSPGAIADRLPKRWHAARTTQECTGPLIRHYLCVPRFLGPSVALEKACEALEKEHDTREWATAIKRLRELDIETELGLMVEAMEAGGMVPASPSAADYISTINKMTATSGEETDSEHAREQYPPLSEYELSAPESFPRPLRRVPDAAPATTKYQSMRFAPPGEEDGPEWLFIAEGRYRKTGEGDGRALEPNEGGEDSYVVVYGTTHGPQLSFKEAVLHLFVLFVLAHYDDTFEADAIFLERRLYQVVRLLQLRVFDGVMDAGIPMLLGLKPPAGGGGSPLETRAGLLGFRTVAAKLKFEVDVPIAGLEDLQREAARMVMGGEEDGDEFV
mmetsp:Transcript_8640/g.24708  ORF Transcript_8640/g.24708 Transcript_8640/m.24708 type:complete len:420 (+) Transcript_8640:372-1631(+)